MRHIKLKDFCEKNSISYSSGHRWFHAGQIPGAYQTGSGTILVPIEDGSDKPAESKTDVMTLVLKKTVELSKSDGTLEDFASWVISTFTLKLKSDDAPKYSKVRPDPKDIQDHFKKFFPSAEKPKPYTATDEENKALIDALNSPDVEVMVNPVSEIDNKIVSDKTSESVASICNSSSVPVNSSNLLTSIPVAGSIAYNTGELFMANNCIPSFSGDIGGTYFTNDTLPTTTLASGAFIPLASNCCTLTMTGGDIIGDSVNVFANGGISTISQQNIPETKTNEKSKRGRKPSSYYTNKESK